jgi:hypothetical protein
MPVGTLGLAVGDSGLRVRCNPRIDSEAPVVIVMC